MNTKAKGAKFELACKEGPAGRGLDGREVLRQQRPRRCCCDPPGGRTITSAVHRVQRRLKHPWARAVEPVVRGRRMVRCDPSFGRQGEGVAAPRFWRVTGLKTGRLGVPQPRVPFDIDVWEADGA